jgi:hypothetical protein
MCPKITPIADRDIKATRGMNDATVFMLHPLGVDSDCLKVMIGVRSAKFGTVLLLARRRREQAERGPRLMRNNPTIGAASKGRVVDGLARYREASGLA